MSHRLPDSHAAMAYQSAEPPWADGAPLGAGAAQGRNCGGRSKMDDVDANAKFPAQPDHQFDGFILGSARPGLQVRFVAPRRVLYSSGIDKSRQFRVNQQQAAVRGNNGQGLPEIRFSHVRKFINPRRHKAPNTGRLRTGAM